LNPLKHPDRPFQINAENGGKGCQGRLARELGPRASASLSLGTLGGMLYVWEHAQVVELVDTLDSGSSGGNTVEVRVLSWALSNRTQSAFGQLAHVGMHLGFASHSGFDGESGNPEFPGT
jgi:hypothetical protein